MKKFKYFKGVCGGIYREMDGYVSWFERDEWSDIVYPLSNYPHFKRGERRIPRKIARKEYKNAFS